MRARILERTRAILRANYPVLEAWVGARRRGAPPGRLPRAGAIAYLRYAWQVNSTALVLRLRDEQSVLVVPGDHFGMDGYLRVGFGNEPEDLHAGLARIDSLLDRLDASAREPPAAADRACWASAAWDAASPSGCRAVRRACSAARACAPR